MKLFATLVFISAATVCACIGHAQGNYEVQVYPSATLAPRTTMLELHSNFTAKGQKGYVNGEAPTHHAVHNTFEITQGLNNWSEVGFYIFTTAQSGMGVEWVGNHIRPRVRAPESWNWPVGVSLSTEIGYQSPKITPDTWSWEIRPIIDKSTGRWYWALNPAMSRVWHGPGVQSGLGFAPNAKVSYDFTKEVAVGVEYYADYGDLRAIVPLHDQAQLIFLASDLDVSPKWEINFGVGVGATAGTDHWLIKGILGRRFDWGNRSK